MIVPEIPPGAFATGESNTPLLLKLMNLGINGTSKLVNDGNAYGSPRSIFVSLFFFVGVCLIFSYFGKGGVPLLCCFTGGTYNLG